MRAKTAETDRFRPRTTALDGIHRRWSAAIEGLDAWDVAVDVTIEPAGSAALFSARGTTEDPTGTQ